jgi:hypothetical protein
MKISFDEILPPAVLLYVETQNSSFFFDFGRRFGPKCTFFSTFDLENYCQRQIFPRSQYQKRVVGEALKILSYYTHTSEVWFGVGRSKRKFHGLSANSILKITVNVMHFQGQNTIDV